MAHQFPPCPASLKAIQHYLKTASEHDQRDPVVSYWCRLYALQLGLKIDRKSDEAKALLTSLMDWLEMQKKAMSDNEAITNDLAAQAHIENYALKLFVYADTQDRAANFGKNVVKAFYTAGMLFDVLTTFGELSEELVQNRKYAKWKAAYIHNCLKNGETPIPGPMKEEGEDNENIDAGGSGIPAASNASGPSNIGFVQPQIPPEVPSNFGAPLPPPGANAYVPPTTPSNHTPSSFPSFPGSGYVPYNPPTSMVTTPSNDGGSLDSFNQYNPTNIASDGNCGSHTEGTGIVLKPDQISKAQKYCKWAGSALNYDDVPTAITNLQKALKLLQTGQDS